MKTHFFLFVATFLIASMGLNAKPVQNSGADSLFKKITTQPEFPGGKAALVEFISSNIKYPEKAKKEGIEGKVFVSFVIKSDGTVSDVEVIRGISKECDAEAKRVISSMPKWKPGMDEEKAVDVKMNLPIHFKLHDKKK